MRKIVLLFLIVLISFSSFLPAAVWEGKTSTIVPVLDFEKASHYEFGFSGGPVNANSPTPSSFLDDGYFVLTGTADGDQITIEEERFYVYWDIIGMTGNSVTLNLSATPLTASVPSTDGNKTVYLPWTLSWNVDNTNTSITAKKENSEASAPVSEVSLQSDTGYSVEEIDSVQIKVSGSFPKADIYPVEYIATVKLSIKDNG